MNNRAERALSRALERGDRPERRRREPQATPVPGLTLTPRNVVALQPAIGNAAVARVIARLKADHRAPVQELRKALAVLEDTVSALLANKRTFEQMHEGYRFIEPDVAALQGHVADAGTLLGQVEAEQDPDAALTEAREAIKAGQAEKTKLDDLYGENEIKKARDALVAKRDAEAAKERKARAEAAYQQQNKAEAQAQTTQRATAVQQRQAALAADPNAPNAAGPAYTYGNTAAGRLNLLASIKLRHPLFSNLMARHIHNQACFLYVLTLAQIARVERFLDGKKVASFKFQGIPDSRASTELQPMVIPNRIEGVAPEIGAEIFCDWVVEKAGHSSTITRINDSFNFTADANFAAVGTTTPKSKKIEYVYNVSRRRLVTNANRSAIVTYFHGR